jgi:GAF domain-containing protein
MEDLLRDLTRIALADRPVGDVLAEIVQVAERGIPAADSVSITLLRGEDPFTAAYSGELALHADEMQYERGYGPCLDAGRGGVVLRVDDMHTEQRWPDYAAQVLQHGVRSSLSIPLPFQSAVIGALDIYSTTPNAFATAKALDAALTVAETIAVTVANAYAHARLDNEAVTLRNAMESRAVIEQAKGVLMAQRGVDADQAFEILREASQRYNRKLRDIAAGIVDSAQARNR